MKNSFIGHVWGSFFLFLLLACHDINNMNNLDLSSVVKNVAQKKLDRRYPKCYFLFDFPLKIESTDIDKYASLHALSELGIVKEATVYSHEVDEINKVGGWEYLLSEEGSKYYTHNDRGQSGFCFGHAFIRDVKLTPLPDVINRIDFVIFSFSYTVEGIPSWVKSPSLVSLNSDLKDDFISEEFPFVKSAVFYKKNSELMYLF